MGALPKRRDLIRTPDQRLRVFVSSTLGELASERAAVRAAIERLRLAPVMFELGARPHPPRALYRAYLEQSHVFIGLYWQSYGWVAPEMTVSGIEDEYQLASGLPCLVYVKDPAPAREPQLEQFLRRMKADDRVSYKRFQSAKELAELVADDLALLLTEYFEAGAAQVAAPASALRPRAFPLAPTRLVGRERELAAISTLIEREDVRLLTLSGMGGIGKTRLALAVASQLHGRFADGAGFADLSSVQGAELVPSAVAVALGVPQEGTRPLAELVIERLTDVELLLVLDGFEHVIAAAPFVARLLASCPKLKLIVTSRALLHLRGEHEFPVPPLELPGGTDAPAVRLFVERAQDHQPTFDLEQPNARDVVELCSRLEGIPLAIELAAARVRVLPPGALLARIADRLDLLCGPSDLPERQRTLRTTLDWSYNLLDPHERSVFAALSVFVGGFTLASAQAICGGDAESDVIEGVSSLIDKSLVVPQQGLGIEPRFRMLETVREYAEERLEQSGDAERTRLTMAEHFADWAEHADIGLTTSEHRLWLTRLDAEVDNLRAVISWADEHERPDLFLRTAIPLWFYWWPRGYVIEMRAATERCLERYPSLEPKLRALQLWGVGCTRAIAGDTEGSIPLLKELMELERARGDERGLALAQWVYCSQSQLESSGELQAMLTQAAETLRRLGDRAVAPFALTTLGVLALVAGDPLEAERLGQEALAQARAIDSTATVAVAFEVLGYSALASGNTALARARFADCARTFQRIQDREGVTYGLDGLAAVALAEGRAELAARAIGAADATRERLGLAVYPVVQRAFRGPFVAAVQAALGSVAFEAARSSGAQIDLDQAVEQLLGSTGSPTVDDTRPVCDSPAK